MFLATREHSFKGIVFFTVDEISDNKLTLSKYKFINNKITIIN